MASESVAIIGAGIAVGGALAAFAVWAFRSVVATEVTPILVQLKAEAAALANEFRQFRETKEEERRETSRILLDLDKIVQSHETRITILEQPTPPAVAARKRGRAA